MTETSFEFRWLRPTIQSRLCIAVIITDHNVIQSSHLMSEYNRHISNDDKSPEETMMLRHFGERRRIRNYIRPEHADMILSYILRVYTRHSLLIVRRRWHYNEVLMTCTKPKLWLSLTKNRRTYILYERTVPCLDFCLRALRISVVNKDLSFKAKAKDLTSEHVQGPL